MYLQNEHNFEGPYLGPFLSELKTKLGLGGPLKLSDFKNGQKFGVLRMYLHNEHNFESLYLCHFLLELKITWKGGSNGSQGFKKWANIWCL